MSKNIGNELSKVCLLVLFILFLKDSAEAIDPTNKKLAFTHSINGLTYQKKGEYQKAISEFTAAIKYDPNDAISYGGRGNAYHMLGSLH